MQKEPDYPRYHFMLRRAVQSAMDAIDEGNYQAASLLLLLGMMESRDKYLETFCEPPCKSE